MPAVHPRACGEHPTHTRAAWPHGGSSPRLRGTQLRIYAKTQKHRFIPAPAGNTAINRSQVRRPAVHPRACGEHGRLDDRAHVGGGSSPRLRGTLAVAARDDFRVRFIPAPAGNTPAEGRRIIRPPVHPRACGEHTKERYDGNLLCGSSPRLRGTPEGDARADQVGRFIPAPAGNTREERYGISLKAVHPRACGEHMDAQQT